MFKLMMMKAIEDISNYFTCDITYYFSNVIEQFANIFKSIFYFLKELFVLIYYIVIIPFSIIVIFYKAYKWKCVTKFVVVSDKTAEKIMEQKKHKIKIDNYINNLIYNELSKKENSHR